MYGSTAIQRLRTRIMPSASGGSSRSFSSKLSRVGRPCGRLFRCHAFAISCSFRSASTSGERHMKRPGGEGETPPGPVSLRWSEAQPATALAVGALKASIKTARAHLALVLAFEQSAASAFVAPAIARLVGRAVEDNLVALNPVDVRAAQRMVDAAAVRIGLGEDQPVARGLVDLADMLAV